MTVIDDIKERLDIIDLVQEYVPLERAGRNCRALCPFHDERTPSFYVFPQRQTWRCFGACAVGGDVFTFLQKRENLDFTQALQELARRARISLSDRSDGKNKGQDESLLHANNLAVAFYNHLLLQDIGKEALAYIQNRGLDIQTIDRFKLGYSPGGQILYRHLQSNGVSLQVAEEAGLVSRGQTQEIRDQFRNRVMFPIHDIKGRAVGFGGRALGNDQPKYLNTSQTPLFNKGGTLYALHLAAPSISQDGTAVIVEGYMDAIAAHQNGFTNVVASMGTALTPLQVALLVRQGHNFVIALDADAAGLEATRLALINAWKVLERRVTSAPGRNFTLIKRPSLPDLKVALLPSGTDPDEFIRSDPLGWATLIRQASTWWDFLFQAEASNYDLSSSHGKAAFAERLFPIVASLENPYEQERMFSHLASTLQVTRSTLEASIGRPKTPRPTRTMRPSPTAASASPFVASESDPLETYTLALLLRYPELRNHVTALTGDHFHRPENHSIFTHWLQSDMISMEDLGGPDFLQEHLTLLRSYQFPEVGDAHREQELEFCIRRLEERRLRRLKMEEALALEQGEEDSGVETQTQSNLGVTEALRRHFTYPKKGTF